MCFLVIFVHLHLKNIGLRTRDLRKSCHDLQTGSSLAFPCNFSQSVQEAYWILMFLKLLRISILKLKANTWGKRILTCFKTASLFLTSVSSFSLALTELTSKGFFPLGCSNFRNQFKIKTINKTDKQVKGHFRKQENRFDTKLSTTPMAFKGWGWWWLMRRFKRLQASEQLLRVLDFLWFSPAEIDQVRLGECRKRSRYVLAGLWSVRLQDH